VPGQRTPYLPYCAARDRFTRITGHLGIEGAHTHTLRHQFASEALDADRPAGWRGG
jgi:integrase